MNMHVYLWALALAAQVVHAISNPKVVLDKAIITGTGNATIEKWLGSTHLIFSQ